MVSKSILSLFVLCLVHVECYNILYVTTIPSPSHKRLGEGCVRPLLKRGHKVTYMGPFPMSIKHDNLTFVDVNFIMEAMETEQSDYMNVGKMINKPAENLMNEWISLMDEVTKKLVQNESIQNFINDRRNNFDLVVVDWLYNNVLFGFGALYQCPIAVTSSFDVHSGLINLVDTALNPSYNDHVMTTHPKPYTFLQRVQMLWELISSAYLVEYLKPGAAQVYDEAFGPAATSRGVQLSSYVETSQNVSLILVNSHPSFGSSVRLPQNVKSVGGYHIENHPPLPKDLQDIMDQAEHGVIYFSLGSNAKSKDLPIGIRDEIIEVLSRLKQTVLWKYEEELTDLPKNVVTRKWMPQAGILAHSNLKLFITHGGLLSTVEAIHYGVPVIGIPCFGDQHSNMERAQRRGNAIKVMLTDTLARDLEHAVREMLGNSSYMEKAKYISWLYHHRPQTPSQELVYWLEYAVETKGAPHLRSPALMLPWYQRFYFDLLALVLAVVAVFVFVCKTVSKFLKVDGKQRRKKQKRN